MNTRVAGPLFKYQFSCICFTMPHRDVTYIILSSKKGSVCCMRQIPSFYGGNTYDALKIHISKLPFT